MAREYILAVGLVVLVDDRGGGFLGGTLVADRAVRRGRPARRVHPVGAQAGGAVGAADARGTLVVEERLDGTRRHAALVEEHLVGDDVAGVELAQVGGLGGRRGQRGADDGEQGGRQGHHDSGAGVRSPGPGGDGIDHATTTSV
jgi:hypothetical protein